MLLWRHPNRWINPHHLLHKSVSFSGLFLSPSGNAWVQFSSIFRSHVVWLRRDNRQWDRSSFIIFAADVFQLIRSYGRGPALGRWVEMLLNRNKCPAFTSVMHSALWQLSILHKPIWSLKLGKPFVSYMCYQIGSLCAACAFIYQCTKIACANGQRDLCEMLYYVYVYGNMKVIRDPIQSNISVDKSSTC